MWQWLTLKLYFWIKQEISLILLEFPFLLLWSCRRWQSDGNRFLFNCSKIKEHMATTVLFIRQTQFCSFLHWSQPAVKAAFQLHVVYFNHHSNKNICVWNRLRNNCDNRSQTKKSIKDITRESQLYSLRQDISKTAIRNTEQHTVIDKILSWAVV